MRARVIVTLKTGVLDPQGKAIEGALTSLGVFGVMGVRQGKVFDVELRGADRTAAQATLTQACEKLLANTVIENYRVEVDEAGGGKAEALERRSAPAGTHAEVIERPVQASDVDPVAATEQAAADADMPTEGHP